MGCHPSWHAAVTGLDAGLTENWSFALTSFSPVLNTQLFIGPAVLPWGFMGPRRNLERTSSAFTEGILERLSEAGRGVPAGIGG